MSGMQRGVALAWDTDEARCRDILETVSSTLQSVVSLCTRYCQLSMSEKSKGYSVRRWTSESLRDPCGNC